jgi:hypothetical protein
MTEIDMTPPMNVAFDDDGNILSIGPGIPAEGTKYFQCDYKKVKRLITLEEDPLNYLVRYDPKTEDYVLLSITKSDEKEYQIAKLEKYDQSFFNVFLQINKTEKTAVLTCDDIIKSKLAINSFTCYFTKKDNPNYLHKSIRFKFDEIVKDDLFSNADDVSIYTTRNLEKVCYEVIE